MNTELLKQLPKIDTLLKWEGYVSLPYGQVKAEAQKCIDLLRREILDGSRNTLPEIDELRGIIAYNVKQANRPGLRRVINATGVVLHTNLGRAPVGKEIISRAAEQVQGYCNLEYNLDRGTRGCRYNHLSRLISEITGAEAALVVNNNAAAVFLVLNSIFEGKSVAVSRGEAVEIGGGFRVPEIMSKSGAVLLDVGTTNKTRIADYEAALKSGRAQGLLKVHTSNFKIIGFTDDVKPESMAQLTEKWKVPFVYDLGSGMIFPLPGISEPSVTESIAAGADIVCFSGDKLLGGVQAGIIAGKKEYVGCMLNNPFLRMFRPDKFTLALLEQVLLQYRDPGTAREKIPALSMLTEPADNLKCRAETFACAIRSRLPQIYAEVSERDEAAGGGAFPGGILKGYAVAIRFPGHSAAWLEEQLRNVKIPVIVTVQKDVVLLSVRTVLSEEEDLILEALEAISRK